MDLTIKDIAQLLLDIKNENPDICNNIIKNKWNNVDIQEIYNKITVLAGDDKLSKVQNLLFCIQEIEEINNIDLPNKYNHILNIYVKHARPLINELKLTCDWSKNLFDWNDRVVINALVSSLNELKPILESMGT